MSVVDNSGENSLGPGSTRVIQGFAAFDLIVTGMLAVPVTAKLFVRLLYRADDWLVGAESVSSAPEIPAIAWLFFSIAGVLGVLWAWVRIVMPIRELAMADAVGRFVVAALIVYYSLGGGLPAALFAFVATELVGSVVQLWILGKNSRPVSNLTHGSNHQIRH